MSKITKFTKLFAVFVAIAALFTAAPAFAQSGCPNLDGKLESEIVGAYFTIGGNQANYYFGSLVDRVPENGVPGLIKYCVYPNNGGPSNAVAVAVGADGSLWKVLGVGGDPEFAFGRPKGNFTNIPLDGSGSTGPPWGIWIGYATWGAAPPTDQTILLHINDAAECENLYPGEGPTWETCWVFPKIDPPWPPQDGEEAKLNVIKFYDANADGINNDDQLITGWKIQINTLITDTPFSEVVEPGEYIVTEFYPIQLNWMPTTPNPVTITLGEGEEKTVEFGNLCLGAGGGLTLGFWSNKNGQALFLADDLAAMVALNLRAAGGGDFDPISYAAFRSWLLSANATNMAYMLSAQLAAMKLNTINGSPFVSPSAIIYAPGTTSANALGFATVGDVMAEANAELGSNGLTLAGSPFRAYQEALKNALDWANNNRTFVQPTPCLFSFEP